MRAHQLHKDTHTIHGTCIHTLTLPHPPASLISSLFSSFSHFPVSSLFLSLPVAPSSPVVFLSRLYFCFSHSNQKNPKPDSNMRWRHCKFNTWGVGILSIPGRRGWWLQHMRLSWMKSFVVRKHMKSNIHDTLTFYPPAAKQGSNVSTMWISEAL